MSVHERPGASDEWYTPPHVFAAMGTHFDMDVAHPGLHVLDWVPANKILTADSLSQPWDGFIWMNPPFGGRNAIVPWLQKFFDHGNGVALVPDRTSAPWWQDFAPRAHAALMVRSKIKFIPGSGVRASSPAQGTTLLAVGFDGETALDMARSVGLGSLWRPA